MGERGLTYSRLGEVNFPFGADVFSRQKNKKEEHMGAITSITIVYKEEGDNEICYCLEDKNIKKADLFLNRAGKGDFEGWEKICSSHSEKKVKTVW